MQAIRAYRKEARLNTYTNETFSLRIILVRHFKSSTLNIQSSETYKRSGVMKEVQTCYVPHLKGGRGGGWR
jgi:hypothetical protein